ncbi:DUF413 domain-containing protein [Aestuariibacter sp. AA17]|uniref:Macrodomain Ori protein n=1 Tax=Fluctibacter corallii TaxID=2984329 RepID=A0ABT3A744_9ALTE|nr:DUF413 domain-containing protein [Aestuariibacter sp. AA17]MCV2884428.1 DUF413 domain-containing protein [Aestuariibacter sp. AA17]
MAEITRDTLLQKNYSDPKNYPYGFARSGDFSISESKALSQYGHLIASLVDGKLAPSTDEDHGFLQAAFGKKEPESVAERAWVKYQKRINRPKLGSIYGTKAADIGDDDDTIDDDAPIELDVDDE